MTVNLDESRHLQLEGTRNIRDLGGYQTVDGRTTRWKTMLRADNLEKLTLHGQRALVDYETDRFNAALTEPILDVGGCEVHPSELEGGYSP